MFSIGFLLISFQLLLSESYVLSVSSHCLLISFHFPFLGELGDLKSLAAYFLIFLIPKPWFSIGFQLISFDFPLSGTHLLLISFHLPFLGAHFQLLSLLFPFSQGQQSGNLGSLKFLKFIEYYQD